MITEEIEKRLFENADEKYRDFQAKLMPGVEIERIIGVRTPVLRKLAKEYAENEKIGEFLSELPHKYYDENNLHGFIISECKDYEKAVKYTDAILPYVDNWATCDLLSPKAFKKNRDRLSADIDRWLSSDRTYTVRFGLEMIMSHFLDDKFSVDFLEKAAEIRSEEYYVNMMLAWLFATALAKQWESTVPFIEQNRLDTWVHNKTIQKACESYRITGEQKNYLKGMKIKR
ncbi:MAG: DNA alkylation repair protein [Clostridia bacterium]|nr:DNA alkylation repair protein [Clostridia bacterium]